MLNQKLRISLFFASIALFLGGCGLLEPFADALAAACEQESFVVTTTDDRNDGICTPEDCTLREAVITANACEGSDTIVLSPTTYVLWIEGANEDEALTGDLDILDHLILQGNGATIDGNNADRILDVQAENDGEMIEFVASDLIIQHGRADQGGGIRNRGFVQLGASTVWYNQAERGGGIYNEGQFVLSGATVSNNADLQYASGILSTGTMEIRDSTVSDNHKVGQDPDDNIVDSSFGVVNLGNMTILRTEILNNNDANDSGTGVANGVEGEWYGEGRLALIGVDASLEMDRVTIAGHTFIGVLSMSDGSQLVITNSTIRDSGWGAMEAYGTTRIESSTIQNNGLSIAHLRGCGSVINYGDMEMENVTLSGNQPPPRLVSPSECPVILNLGTASITYSTIYANSFYAIKSPEVEGASLTLLATIIGRNMEPNCRGGGIVTQGQNLADDDSCELGDEDQVLAGASLNLGPLAENGSYNGTWTHALLLGSPAINAAGTDCPANDQRGIGRPQWSACDAGAFEQNEVFISVDPGSSPLPGPDIRLMRDTLCWTGPGSRYPVVRSVSEGETAAVQGIGADDGWLVIEHPQLPGVNCWVNRQDVEEPQAFDPGSLQVFAIPPLPEPTATETVVGCRVFDPQNNIVCVPRACTPNDQPGGSCTP